MKRGFLLKAEAKKAAAQRRGSQKKTEPQPEQVNLEGELVDSNPIPKRGVISTKLAYGNLTEQQRALPSDYDPNKVLNQVTSTESDHSKVEFAQEVRLITTLPQPVPEGETQCEWIVNGPTKAKVFKAPGYPARIPKPRRPDLYQVRSTPDMGLGVFAKHHIKRGELIFAERPLIVAPRGIKPLSQGAVPDHYTEHQIKQIVMFEFEGLLQTAFDRLSPESQADFKALHNAHTADGSGPLLGIVRSNGFGINSLYDGTVSNETSLYGAVCKLGSRLNHSCKPNVRYYFKLNSFSMQFYAVRNIKPGEQLYYSYCPIEHDLAQRQADLAPYGFVCKCPACVNATPETDQLRKTFEAQITRFKDVVASPSVMDEKTVLGAVKLANDMIKEGLDSVIQFVALAAAISLAYVKRGDLEKCQDFAMFAESFQDCFKQDE